VGYKDRQTEDSMRRPQSVKSERKIGNKHEDAVSVSEPRSTLTGRWADAPMNKPSHAADNVGCNSPVLIKEVPPIMDTGKKAPNLKVWPCQSGTWIGHTIALYNIFISSTMRHMARYIIGELDSRVEKAREM
jgi:hypothetical protein